MVLELEGARERARLAPPREHVTHEILVHPGVDLEVPEKKDSIPERTWRRLALRIRTGYPGYLEWAVQLLRDALGEVKVVGSDPKGAGPGYERSTCRVSTTSFGVGRLPGLVC